MVRNEVPSVQHVQGNFSHVIGKIMFSGVFIVTDRVGIDTTFVKRFAN